MQSFDIKKCIMTLATKASLSFMISWHTNFLEEGSFFDKFHILLSDPEIYVFFFLNEENLGVQ